MTSIAMAVPMTWTDEELVRWERPIFALAYRTLGREEDARDVTQETFLRAFRALPGFKGDAKFSSWLYRIALNLCRDWMRKDRRTPVVAVPEGVNVEQLVSENHQSASVEDLAARAELSRGVAKAMEHLPEEQRTAILLKEYHGLTFQEIADMTNCPLSTAKTRVYQGLTLLRKHLAEQGQFEPPAGAVAKRPQRES
jgi:RNA polymerase sigma-70 factor (ECF subfamily)